MNPIHPHDAIIKEITINAPAERVFDAITDPSQRVKWWGVAGKFQVTEMESDLQPGGAWKMCGTQAEDRPFRVSGIYRVVERPQLLEFTWRFDGPEPETLVRFELAEQQGVTTVRLIHSGFATEESRQRYQGWPWLLSLLRTYVEDRSSGRSL